MKQKIFRIVDIAFYLEQTRRYAPEQQKIFRFEEREEARSVEFVRDNDRDNAKLNTYSAFILRCRAIILRATAMKL